MGQCPCLLHTGCLSFREHVYWPDGLQGLLWPKQNGFECVEDPHQVGDKVTRILNITVNDHGSLCTSVLYAFSLVSCAEWHIKTHKGNVWNTKMFHQRHEKKMNINKISIHWSSLLLDSVIIRPFSYHYGFWQMWTLIKFWVIYRGWETCFLAHSHIESADCWEEDRNTNVATNVR